MDGMHPDDRRIPPRPDLPRRTSPPWQSMTWPAPAARRKPSALVAVVVVVAVFLAGSGLFIAAIPSLVRPRGEATDHAFLYEGLDGPARWNPCEPIYYVVNLGRSAPDALDDVTESVRRISEATGITFVYDGTTDERPRSDRDPVQPERYGPGWAPVLIAWADPDETDIEFEADEHELAVAVARPWIEGPTPTMVTGWIVVNEEVPVPAGFTAPGGRGVTLLHEWGHIMGLDHVESVAEVMHPSSGHVTDLGPGDRAGLRELGIEQGCRTAPGAPG